MRRLTIGTMIAVLGWSGLASAQAELTGTHIRYLRVGANGALVDIPGARSMQYSESGTAADVTCDVYFPGSPAVGFTVLATPAGGVAATASNNSFSSDVTTTSAPAVTGRAIDWSGNWTTGAVDVDVTQRVEYASTDRLARVTVTLTNGGTTSLSDVYYFFSGDPDHGECEIGTDYYTNNDVVRQPPGSTSALATASIGTPAYTFAVGSADPRARANTSGFENTDAFAAWNTPVDAAGALLDEDIGIVFREPTLAPGASTTFVFYIVWGISVAQVEARFDLAVAIGAANGTACGTAAACLSGFCVDGVCCDTACGG
ncbi:MAG: hypothetical protein M3Y87_34280, partial [Myxococcota bacterium]|nr:hypothetical protein [Myxococcota bacterium]